MNQTLAITNDIILTVQSLNDTLVNMRPMPHYKYS